MRLALLPSPLLGPAVWTPVAAELTRRGWDARLPGGVVMAEGPLREHLAVLVGDDGLLPVWTQWWPDEDLAGRQPAGAAPAHAGRSGRRGRRAGGAGGTDGAGERVSRLDSRLPCGFP
jgi:hypothetical protein